MTEPHASPTFATSAANLDPTLVTGHVEELVRAAVEMVFLVDPAHRIVYASQNVQSLLGHDPLQIVGQSMSGLVHPAHAAPFDAALAKALTGSRLGEAELRWPRLDGNSSLGLLVGFTSLGADASAEGIMVTVRHGASRDLVSAALGDDDDRVRTIGTSAPLVVFLLDGKGRCIWINDRWTVLSGQTPEAAAGLGWVNGIEEHDRTPFRTEAAAAHRRRSGWRQQFRSRDADGVAHWVDAAAAPRFDGSGAISGYVGAMADITAEVRGRTELNKRTTIVESTAEFVVMEQRGPRLVYSDTDSAPLVDTPPVPAASKADGIRASLGALPGESQAQYLNEIRPTVLADGVWQAGVATVRPSVEPATAMEPPNSDDITAADVAVPRADGPRAVLTAVVPLAVPPIVKGVAGAGDSVVGAPTVAVGPIGEAGADVAPTDGAARPAKVKLSPAGQPIAWNFDAVETGDGPVSGWQNPAWAQPVAPPATSGRPGRPGQAGESADRRGPTGDVLEHLAGPPAGDVGQQSDAQPVPSGSPEQVYVGLVGPSGSVESIASVSDGVLEPTEFENLGDQLPAVDPITGLANRALFQERIRLALKRMSTDGVSVAVMLPNLHGYQDLRAQVGAKTGDDQLFVVSKRLEATIRQVDTAARIGESDFAILGVGWFFPGDVENVAKRFILRIQEPVPSIGRQVSLPCSMGIAMALPDEPIGTILRRAQRARKMAAELGPGRVYVDYGAARPPTTD